MADKKVSAPSPSYTIFEILFFLIIFSSFASLITNWVSENREIWSPFLKAIPFYIVNIYTRYIVFSFFLSIALFILTVVYLMRENDIRRKIMNKVLPPNTIVKNVTENIKTEHPKWKIVEQNINSDDANKWKLSILEADIILSELLDSLNLPGDGIGEKLKSVERGDFEHIDQAWEAHKIRNAIAHEGSDFLITQREAKRVIDLYRSVFEEFEII